jgi:HPt (histidine-containing phosphotransfer) domain-containing protein/CheY-like chemotaxis protein
MTFLKLLLVENDPRRAVRIAASLSSGNLDVVTVATRDEVMSALALRQFDVVLLTSATNSLSSLLTFEISERNGAAPVLVTWGDNSAAGEGLAISAAVPEQDLAAEILRVYQEADLRRDAASEALPVFDPVEFRNQMGGDEALIREIVGLFFEDSIGQLHSIRTILDDGDAQNASPLAHSLKGALGSLRAARAQRCAAVLEKATAAGDAPRSKRAFAALEKAMDELAIELQAILDA